MLTHILCFNRENVSFSFFFYGIVAYVGAEPREHNFRMQKFFFDQQEEIRNRTKTYLFKTFYGADHLGNGKPIVTAALHVTGVQRSPGAEQP